MIIDATIMPEQYNDVGINFSIFVYTREYYSQLFVQRYYHDVNFVYSSLIRYIRNEQYSHPDLSKFSSMSVNR